MSDFFKNLTAYDLINVLVPGAIIVAVSDYLGFTSLYSGNVFLATIVSYVSGIVASRVGSIALEPVAIRVGVIDKGSYHDYVKAKAKDADIEKISMVANSYRSLCGAICICLLLLAFSYTPLEWRPALKVVAMMLIILLFLAAWFKQSHYVGRRVEVWKERAADDED